MLARPIYPGFTDDRDFYEFIFVVYDREGYFGMPQNPSYTGKVARELLETYAAGSDQWHIQIMRVMPNHIHILLDVAEGTPEEQVRAMAEGFRMCVSEYFHPYLDGKDILHKDFHLRPVVRSRQYNLVYEHISRNHCHYDKDEFCRW